MPSLLSNEERNETCVAPTTDTTLMRLGRSQRQELRNTELHNVHQSEPRCWSKRLIGLFPVFLAMGIANFLVENGISQTVPAPNGTLLRPSDARNEFGNARQDLITPMVEEGAPSPGRRAIQWVDDYQSSSVRHTIYLPIDWSADRKYPVLFEYAGNGRTVLGGQPCLGYGLSGGRGYIWVCLPFVAEGRMKETDRWWGDLPATVDYCKRVASDVCERWGGNSEQLVLCGFSRGSIACNVVGLHDDQIAAMWKAFVCHSHYDDGRWSGTTREASIARLRRLGAKPQWISNERPVVAKEGIREFLLANQPAGNFEFVELPFDVHTENWVLYDIPERLSAREWLARQLKIGH